MVGCTVILLLPLETDSKLFGEGPGGTLLVTTDTTLPGILLAQVRTRLRRGRRVNHRELFYLPYSPQGLALITNHP